MENSPDDAAGREQIDALAEPALVPLSPAEITEPFVTPDTPGTLSRLAFIISLGWLGTNLGLGFANLPLKFILISDLKLTPQAVAGFFAVGQFFNYIKPAAGLLCDSVPLFGYRRRYYLLLSLLITGLAWLIMNVVPRTANSLLLTYTLLYIMVVFTSTSLGGVMVEIGTRFRAAGRMTAQRIAMFRIGSLFGDLIGGRLATMPFVITASLASLLHLMLIPLYIFYLPEERLPPEQRRINWSVWRDAGEKLKGLYHNRVLMSAAGMIFLVAASPGFNTPLLFYQTNTLHFSKPFVGILGSVSAASGLLAAVGYYAACRRLPIRVLLGRQYLHSCAWNAVLSGLPRLHFRVPDYRFERRHGHAGDAAHLRSGRSRHAARQRSAGLFRDDERVEPDQRAFRLVRFLAVWPLPPDVSQPRLAQRGDDRTRPARGSPPARHSDAKPGWS